MRPTVPEHKAPSDAAARMAQRRVICFPIDALPPAPIERYRAARDGAEKVDEILIAPRTAGIIKAPAGHIFRISSVDGPQVGDLNLWNADDISERFFSAKTRALYGTHLSTGDRLMSTFPHYRPMATIIDDSLDWYGFDADGASVHDVIGSRCDPYTGRLLSGGDYHYCCHSNLVRALADYENISDAAAEGWVHDVMNVFMCTGFTHETHQYFMKASPVRPGDYIDYMAEIDLLVGLSACPGGDCGQEHSSDVAACYPLKIEILRPHPHDPTCTERSPYSRTHGRGEV